MVVFSSHLGNSLYMLCVGRAQTKISVCTCDAAMNLSGTMASDLDDDSIDIERSDPTAEFLELYSHNYPRLQFYLMTLFPFPDDAADVLQETSLVLWKKFDTYTTGTNFFAWACKIARLQALNHRKQRGKAALMFNDQLLETLAVEAAEDRFAPVNSLRHLRQCLERLSERDQQLIRKRYEPGMSVARLAENIGRTANSLSKSLGRIRRSLLECIERKRVADSRE
jgi:RNA polymerase sigma-70 factor (ECF subfamily)